MADTTHPGGKKVMIVEDDPLLSDLLSRKMAEKFDLIYAGSGEEALELLKMNSPDLILLDIMLPGIDGFEVLRQVKADPKTAGIPVVILSNLGQQSDIERGKKLGAAEFVVKVSLLPDQVVNLAERVCAEPQKPAA